MPQQFILRAATVTLIALGAYLPAPTAGAAPVREMPASDQSALYAQFLAPPVSARPRVWWHWMNGNITQDGVTKDLAWMKRVGIGGAQVFDAGLATPQVVTNRLAYMSPEWKQVFRAAASEADKLGLELAIATAPGWSETGGPWVPPEDGLKKVVWSETAIVGGQPFTGKLAAPPSIAGAFQTMKTTESVGSGPMPSLYKDVAVYAFAAGPPSPPLPTVTDETGTALDAANLFDQDLETGISLTRGTSGAPAMLVLTYPTVQSIRSATLFLPGAETPQGPTVAARLEAREDSKNWKVVASFTLTGVPTTVSFAAVTAREFRIVLENALPNGRAPTAPGIVMQDPQPSSIGGRSIRIADLSLSGDARIDRFEAKAGFAIVPDYYALTAPSDGAMGIDKDSVIDLTSRLTPDGSLNWSPPAGNWRLLRLGYSLLGTTNHPASKEATGLEVDKFDGPAVKRYLDHYIGMYRDTTGPGLLGAHGVRAVLTDSIEVGAANWTPRFIEQFKQLRGYDPTPWLPALTGTLIGTRDQSDRFLYDYRRTLADLMASQHYGTVATEAHKNGLLVYGEALEDGRPSIGDDMAMRKYADRPMAALWSFRREDGPRTTYLADMKGAASVAHLYGQNIVAAESMTSRKSFWAFAPSDLRRVIDLEFVSGVNLPVIHTSVHQPVDDKIPGVSLGWFGQYFNRNETWAEMARPWVDYMARNAFLLQQGRNVADVAYFYGEEAPLTGLYGDTAVADAPKANAYDFVNADALVNSLKNDGTDLVSEGGARYRVLYLGGSSQHMTLATLQKIASLVEGGATLVGRPPQSDPSLMDDGSLYAALVKRLWGAGPTSALGKGRVIATGDIEAALRQIGIQPDFAAAGRQTDSDIAFLHRQTKDADIYFLVNQKDRPEQIEARFRVSGKIPELWHADTGQAEPVSFRIAQGQTLVPLSLAAEESVYVVFRKTARNHSAVITQPRQIPLAQLDGPWAVSFQQGRGAPTQATLPALAPLNDNSDPGVKYFSGVATYKKSFVAPTGWTAGRPLLLDLGEVGDLAQVIVNGKDSGTAWHAPFKLDIGPFLHRGQNTLEIRVADLWVNRLIGDAQPGATKVTFTTMPTYRADAPLRRSGLIGPVQLIGLKP